MALSRSGARRAVAEGSAKDLGHCTTLFLCVFSFSRLFLILLATQRKQRAIFIGIKISLSKARERRKFRASFEEKCRRIRIAGEFLQKGLGITLKEQFRNFLLSFFLHLHLRRFPTFIVYLLPLFQHFILQSCITRSCITRL